MTDMLSALARRRRDAARRRYGREQPVLRAGRRSHVRRRTARTIQYVSRRFIPQPQYFATLVSAHGCSKATAIDVLAARYLRRSARCTGGYCDANLAVRPDDLAALSARSCDDPAAGGVA